MLAQFSFSNYKCFKEEHSFDLIASNIKNKGYYAHETAFNFSLLKTLAFYGANASGKTKLFEALQFMRSVICPPKRDNKVPVFDFWQTTYDSFRLNTESEETESYFEAVFIIDDKQYRYGFSLDKSEIKSEWLYLKKQRETPVFVREGEDINLTGNHVNDKIYNAIVSADMLSPRIPLLVILATFNDPLSTKVVGWFKNMTIISANDLKSFGMRALMEPEKKKSIVSFLKAFDINIEDVSLHEIKYDDIPEKIKAIIGEESQKGFWIDGVNTLHKMYNERYELIGSKQFSLEIDESFGTNRLFCLSWPIINSLRNGSLLLIDEFDSGIHTNIIKMIISLYYRCQSNAQLIINTQNASLLGATEEESGHRLFRKDQIYLVNKNRYGESSILPVTDFSDDLRANLEKYYLNGDITGVPNVNIEKLLNLIVNNKDNEEESSVQ